MELGSWSIIQAPSLLALIPLVVYIVLVFRGKNNVSGIIVGIFLAVLMLGQNLKAVFLCQLLQHFLTFCIKAICQHLFPVFCTPDEMILQRVHITSTI